LGGCVQALGAPCMGRGSRIPKPPAVGWCDAASGTARWRRLSLQVDGPGRPTDQQPRVQTAPSLPQVGGRGLLVQPGGGRAAGLHAGGAGPRGAVRPLGQLRPAAGAADLPGTLRRVSCRAGRRVAAARARAALPPATRSAVCRICSVVNRKASKLRPQHSIVSRCDACPRFLMNISCAGIALQDQSALWL
jgi:hypothetical protein